MNMHVRGAKSKNCGNKRSSGLNLPLRIIFTISMPTVVDAEPRPNRLALNTFAGVRNFGLKVGTISRGRFEHRIRELAAGNPMLEDATEPMLRARGSLRQELAGLERRVRQLAHEDPVCHRLMSMPGIGAVVALTYRSAVDDPTRFTSSKKGGPWVGLTPSCNQSGERNVSGGITKAGDVNLRRALYQAVTVMMHRGRST